MEALLVLAGLLGGFAAGLIGIGGGIIFAPVLLLYFQSIGVSDELVTPLAIGTSLLCTVVTSVVSARRHYLKSSVNLRVAVTAGLASAAAVLLTTMFVTMQPWYDQQMFGIAFSIVLFAVALQMLMDKSESSVQTEASGTRNGSRIGTLAATGSVAGIVASAVGVGGGVVLVPTYNRFLRLPIHHSIGTSSATIIIIASFGVASYVAGGFGEHATSFSIGFVDPLHAAYLSIPAAVTARFGVWAAHRVNQRRLQQGFAVFAILVAIRIVAGALF